MASEANSAAVSQNHSVVVVAKVPWSRHSPASNNSNSKKAQNAAVGSSTREPEVWRINSGGLVLTARIWAVGLVRLRVCSLSLPLGE